MSAFADYYLQVDLIVTEENAPRFEELVKQFVYKGSFKRFVPTADWRLALGLKTPKTYVYGGDASPPSTSTTQFVETDPLRGQRVFKYLNLWKILTREALDMAPIMVASADDSLYIAIDSLVAVETQNLVGKMHWPGEPASGTHILDSNNFARVTRRFFTSRDLAKYAYNIPVVRPVQERAGLRNLGYFQNATGTLSTITELWQTTASGATLGAAALSPGAKLEDSNPARLALIGELQRLSQRERLETFRSYL
jgi:hypothetical protein